MKKSHAFSPAVSDQLETRTVMSTLMLPGAHSAAIVGPQPVVHPPGTFSQGDLPSFFTAPTGQKFKLSSITVAPPHAVKAVSPAATIRPTVVPSATVVPPTPVVHPPGTFSQGNLPSFFTAPTGEKFKLS